MLAYLYDTIKKLSLFCVPASWCTTYNITTEFTSYLELSAIVCKILGIRLGPFIHSFKICILSSLENSWSAAEISFFLTDKTIFQRLRQATSHAIFLMEIRCSDTDSYYRGWGSTVSSVSLEDKVVIIIDEPFQQISSGTTSGTVTTSKSCSKYVWI